MPAFRYEDPLDRIFRRIDRLTGSSVRAATPLLPEEEAQSLVDSLLNSSVGALQYVGETLDKPGRAVRGLLAGRPEELLNLIPFSDTMGLTDPAKGVSGRDLLDQYGITPQNVEGFHPIDNPTDALGDVAGFAAEVALDPLSYLTFGTSAVGRGGQALKKVGALTPDVIQAGVRGRVGNTVGDVLGRLDDATKTLANDSLSEAAAKYGGTVDDLLVEKVGGHIGIGLPFMDPMAVVGTGADGISGLAARGVGGLGDAIRHSRPYALGRGLLGRDVYGATNPIAQDAIAPRVQAIRRNDKNLVRGMQEMVEAAPELADDTKNLDIIAQHTLGPDAPDELAHLGFDVNPVSAETQKVIADNIAKDAKLYSDALETGFSNIGDVSNDKYIRNYRNRPGNLPEYATGDAADAIGSGKRFKTQYSFMRGRDRAVRDIPGGDVAINKLSTDARFVGEGRLTGNAATEELMSQLWGYSREGGDAVGDFVPDFLDAPSKSLADVRGVLRQMSARAKSYKAVRAWQKTVGEVAGANGWNKKALDRAVREFAQAEAERLAPAVDAWKFMDDSLRTRNRQQKLGLDGGGPSNQKKGYGKLRRAILNSEDEMSPALKGVRFDEWKERMLESGIVPQDVFDDFETLKDYIRNGRPKVPYKNGRMNPTRELIEQVASDDALREEMNVLAKQKLTDEQKAIYADYKKAGQLQKWLAKRDPRHVSSGIGIYDRPYVEAQRAYQSQLFAARQMGEGVHDMFAASAVVTDKAGPDMLSLADAIKATVASNAPNRKAAEAMLERAMAFQSKKLSSKFGQVDASKVYVPSKVVKEAQKVLRNWRTPEEIGELGKAIDKITNWFKVGVTAFPAFHVRNLTSGLVQNVMNGLVDPKEFLPLANISRQVVTGKEVIKGLSDIKAFKGLTDAQATAKLRKLITAYEVWGDKFHGNMSSVVDEAPKLFPKHGIATIQEKLTARQPVSFVKEVVGTGKDIVKAGRQALNPWSEKFAGKRLYQLHGETGRYVEGINRISAFLGGLKKGLSPAEAATRTAFSQVDYANMSQFERAFMKRAFPFWSFSRGIAENVASNLLEHPGGRMAQAIRASNSMRDTGEFLPDYVGESATIPTGNPGQYITSLGLAHESPFEWFAKTPTLPGTVKRIGQKFGSQLTPYLKMPIEMMTGVNLFTGRNQEDLYQYPFSGETGAGRLGNMLLGNSPASRWVNNVRRLTDERKSPGVKTLGVMTGLGITDVSEPERAKDMAVRRAVEEILSHSPRFKRRQDTYLPKENEADATDYEKLLNQMLKTLNKKQRDAAKKKAEKKAAE